MATQALKSGAIPGQGRLPESTYPPPPLMFQDASHLQQDLHLRDLQSLQSRSPRHLHAHLQNATLPIPLSMQNHLHSVQRLLPAGSSHRVAKGMQASHASPGPRGPQHIPCASLKSSSKHRSSAKMNLNNSNNTISCVYIDKNGVTTATWSKDGKHTLMSSTNNNNNNNSGYLRRALCSEQFHGQINVSILLHKSAKQEGHTFCLTTGALSVGVVRIFSISMSTQRIFY